MESFWGVLKNELIHHYHFERPDPLVQLAIIHAQFELIHPFLDGNGRLGRMIVPLFLFERKLISHPVFYISAYLEQHRDKYVAGLRLLHEKNRKPGRGGSAFS